METKPKRSAQFTSKSFLASQLLPNDKQSQQILRSRAVQLAKTIIENDKKSERVAYVRFCLSNKEQYGIPYQHILEVVDEVSLTKLPRTLVSIAGVMNYRGNLLTIVDLKNFLKLKTSSYVHPYVIIIEIQGLKYGLLVDDVEDSDDYEMDALNKNKPYDGLVNSRYVLGLHQSSIAILNIENITLDLQRLLETH